MAIAAVLEQPALIFASPAGSQGPFENVRHEQ
jgi:hypothetical protein